MKIIYATRKSQLALAQSRAFVRSLQQLSPDLECVELTVTTSGDRIQDRPLSDIGGKGLFVKEIEEALLSAEADIAVHSLKDVPPELAAGLVLGCIPRREDPRDVLVSRSGAPLAELPRGARVGTSSLRRRVQLAEQRPDLEIVPLRGNVDTRLRKCREGEVEAVVLAAAGLARLGMSDVATERLDPSVCLPAVGQGALGIEQRANDAAAAGLLALATDEDTRRAVSAERGVMRAVEGNCQTPVAAHAVRAGEALWLRAFLSEPDGSRVRRREVRTPWPENYEQAERIGRELGAELRG
jgi:hydroxymethylbilane synthase